MPRVHGASSGELPRPADCSGCRKQSGTMQCIECLRDGSGSAVFCANGCFKTHWQAHRQGLVRQSSSPAQSPAHSAKVDALRESPVISMKTGGVTQRALSGQTLFPSAKERIVFRADSAAFHPQAVYATGPGLMHRR